MCESRCGMKCSSCSVREEYGCDGCVSDEKPTLGEECEIKVCCESRKLTHCGQCGDFPCDLLRNTSFDEEDGDDGERIINCKHWADSENEKKYSKRNNIVKGASFGLVSGAIIGSISERLAVWIPLGIFIGIAVAVMIVITKND